MQAVRAEPRGCPILAAALLVGAVVAPQAAPAQRLDGVPQASADSAFREAVSFAPRPIGPGWLHPLASLVLPGSGHLMAREDRGVLYLAAEVWIAARAIALNREGRRARSRYRDMAYEVARRRFSSERRDGPFTYYEAMGQYVESGAYDADPGAPFVPESDTSTFNGSVWLLARMTYFTNPDSMPDPSSPQYQAALSFYQARAFGPEYRWSWRDARLEQDVYRATIHESDEAFRGATNYLGALVMNHLVSAVDALVRRRLGARRAAPRVWLRGLSEVHLAWSIGGAGPTR